MKEFKTILHDFLTHINNNYILDENAPHEIYISIVGEERYIFNEIYNKFIQKWYIETVTIKYHYQRHKITYNGTTRN